MKELESGERHWPKRKNRRRWCRGKVGIEHTPIWKKYPQIAWINKVTPPMVFACTKCGKYLGYWFPHFASYDNRPQPKEGSSDQSS